MKKAATMVLLGASLWLVGCNKEAPAEGTAAAAPSPDGSFAITVDDMGYHPSEVKVPAGKPTKLVFKRTSEEGCGQEVAFPDLKIRKELPLNQPVTVEFTMPPSGKVTFTCGMAMMRGSVIAQ